MLQLVSNPAPIFLPSGTGRAESILIHIYSRVLIEDRGYKSPDGCNECYIWQGGDTGKEGRGANYPKMSLDGQSVRVHRVVFACVEGFIHSKRQVDHRCAQRMCVRFEHLRTATHKQNMRFRDLHNGVVRRKRRRKKVRK